MHGVPTRRVSAEEMVVGDRDGILLSATQDHRCAGKRKAGHRVLYVNVQGKPANRRAIGAA